MWLILEILWYTAWALSRPQCVVRHFEPGSCLNIKMLSYQYRNFYIDGLVQDCSNSSASAMELLQSFTKLSVKKIRLSYLENVNPHTMKDGLDIETGPISLPAPCLTHILEQSSLHTELPWCHSLLPIFRLVFSWVVRVRDEHTQLLLHLKHDTSTEPPWSLCKHGY